MATFINEVKRLKELLNNAPLENKRSREFGASAIELHKKNVARTTENVRTLAFELGSLMTQTSHRKDLLRIFKLVEDPQEHLDELIKLASGLNLPKNDNKLKIPVVPDDIKSQVAADIRELEKTFSAQCYRAATILCGRILETCLHRKYFDATGTDILEKNPGIGLGKLIAKLSEKNVRFDPGLTQQIHLINQVRIHSVHVKKESFNPNKQQAYAMILYTLDVAGRMFQ